MINKKIQQFPEYRFTIVISSGITFSLLNKLSLKKIIIAMLGTVIFCSPDPPDKKKLILEKVPYLF